MLYGYSSGHASSVCVFYHSMCLSFFLSVCLSLCMTVCVSVSLSACLFGWVALCLCLCLSICLSVCPIPVYKACDAHSLRFPFKCTLFNQRGPVHVNGGSVQITELGRRVTKGVGAPGGGGGSNGRGGGGGVPGGNNQQALC